jgi:hypothetical protein
MSQTAAFPSDVPLELSKLRVEHTPCTVGRTVVNRVGCDYAIGVVLASRYAFALVSGLLFVGRGGDLAGLSAAWVVMVWR